jgi:uncharacterized protein YndB with AHSA1/START domain
MTADRILRTVQLHAPVSRVWHAISDARQFGSWFGVEFDGPFVAGQPLTGRITPTQVDAEVARLQEPHRGKPFEFVLERIEPQRLFSFRWHPFAIDPGVDYSREPMTLVEFELQDQRPDTGLIITESGFEGIPLARRAAAFQANEGGWSHQSRLIEKYLARQERD